MEKDVMKPNAGGSARILVVEDDPDISSLLGILVKKYGFSLCGTTDNGEDAIGLIRQTDPDIVFIDIVLGGAMNGVELARYINREFKIPFIYITAYSEQHLIEQVIHTSPAAFILKPFKGEEIRVAVELIMNRRRSGHR
jgi:DNA-binding response OmpR family regulator